MRTDAARIDGARRARFEAVAAEVYEPLQRFLRRRAVADDAGDVLAATLLVVWRRLDEVPSDPLPWCYGVARRSLANLRRGNDRRLRLVERAAAQPGAGMPANGDPQDVIEHTDPELEAAIATLSAAEAEVVRLWAWEYLEPREIATVLEMTPNAVSVALTRAKRKLADRLAATHARPMPDATSTTDRIVAQVDTSGVEAPPWPPDQGGDER